MEHYLKTDPAPFSAIWAGEKRAELRCTKDRDFRTGDRLVLEEYDMTRGEAWYTGRRVYAKITHIQKGYGLDLDYAMLSFKISRRTVGDLRKAPSEKEAP